MFTPDIAYLPNQWSNFLVAEVGAAAALTGLLFVSISINLAKIIAFPHLTPRAAKALITLTGIVFAASICLVPGQSRHLLGSELTVLGAFVWIAITRMQHAYTTGNRYITSRQKWFHGTLAQLSAFPLLVCGVSLFLSRGGGLYWLVVATIVSSISALLDAWVLLIEIQR